MLLFVLWLFLLDACTGDPETLAPSEFSGTVAPDAASPGPNGGDAGLGVDAGFVDAGPIRWDPEPGPPPMAFAHGVASGDPLTDRVILWTRVSPPSGNPPRVDVGWSVSSDPDFVNVSAQGVWTTYPERDYTVKVDATGLTPGQTYWYRFEAEGVRSPVGRTKTLPMGPLGRVRFAVVSCAHFEVGYFNVYRLIARRRTPENDLDAVIHLGDYLYEYGAEEYGDAIAGREPQPAHEVITLEDYRTRHAQYKTDLDLQAMHASHPVIAVWDDHELANNAWREGAENHDPSEGPWAARKRASVQAYYEWMPVRDPSMGGTLFRRFQYGELLTLHMLDTRLEGRDAQYDFGRILSDPIAGAAQLIDALLDEDRTLLGSRQETWLRQGLLASTTTWQILGNQVMMGQLYAPLLPELPDLSGAAQAEATLMRTLARLAEGALSRFLPGPGLPVNVDAWDGYIPARTRLFDTLDQVDNVVVVTGDFHNGWALELARDEDLKAGGAYRPDRGLGTVGVEFLTPSVTSPGFEGIFPGVSLETIRGLMLDKNDHIKWANLQDRGFMVLTVTPERSVTQYVFSPNILSASVAQTLGPRFEVPEGQKRILGP